MNILYNYDEAGLSHKTVDNCKEEWVGTSSQL